jgi:hypothetical protein
MCNAHQSSISREYPMFRKSQSSSAPDLFSNFESHFKDRKQNQLNDENGWHNVFYGHITSKVDEVSIFGVIQCESVY